MDAPVGRKARLQLSFFDFREGRGKVREPRVTAVVDSSSTARHNVLDKKYTAGFEVSGEIKRSDFGMKTDLPLVGDDVDLIISAAFEHS